jgi:hypothetical protein
MKKIAAFGYELQATIAKLGDEELLVLAYVARRLLLGQEMYGRLNAKEDERDFDGEETAQELADVVVYDAMAWLKRHLAKEEK